MTSNRNWFQSQFVFQLIFFLYSSLFHTLIKKSSPQCVCWEIAKIIITLFTTTAIVSCRTETIFVIRCASILTFVSITIVHFIATFFRGTCTKLERTGSIVLIEPHRTCAVCVAVTLFCTWTKSRPVPELAVTFVPV